MSLKRSLRKSEIIYLSLQSSYSRASFIEQRMIYKLAISYVKYSYYIRVINDIASDNRRLFRLTNKLLSPPKSALLPSLTNISPLQLGCLFSKTCYNNIDSIIIKIKNHNLTANYPSIIATPPISAFLRFFVCHIYLSYLNYYTRPRRYIHPILFQYLFLNFTLIIYVKLSVTSSHIP